LDVCTALLDESKIGRLSDRQQHCVAGHAFADLVVEHRRKPAVGVIDTFTLPEHNPCNRARRVALDLRGAPTVVPRNPFFVAFQNFKRVGGHLLQGFQRHEVDARRAG
jgi:hypothetical protein